MRISDWSSDVCSSDLTAHFAFYGTRLAGTPQQRSRDKRALAALDTYLGAAVGRAYAEKYFPASAKAEVSDMVDGIKAAFAKRVNTIDWMAPETKQEALTKVETIVVGVCYPETWRYYGSYSVARSEERRVGKGGVRACSLRSS